MTSQNFVSKWGPFDNLKVRVRCGLMSLACPQAGTVETDTWAVAQRVSEVVEVDEVVLHEAKGRQLVEVKAARFLTDETTLPLCASSRRFGR